MPCPRLFDRGHTGWGQNNIAPSISILCNVKFGFQRERHRIENDSGGGGEGGRSSPHPRGQGGCQTEDKGVWRPLQSRGREGVHQRRRLL
jgi:hypothetical protein